MMAPGPKGRRHFDRVVDEIEKIAKKLGMLTQRSVNLGQTAWGSKRIADIELKKDDVLLRLSVITQESTGSAYLKAVAELYDIELSSGDELGGRKLIYAGAYFDKMQKFVGFLASKGAIHISALEPYLKSRFSQKKKASKKDE